MDGCVGIAPRPRATQNKHAESENSGKILAICQNPENTEASIRFIARKANIFVQFRNRFLILQKYRPHSISRLTTTAQFNATPSKKKKKPKQFLYKESEPSHLYALYPL